MFMLTNFALQSNNILSISLKFSRKLRWGTLLKILDQPLSIRKCIISLNVQEHSRAITLLNHPEYSQFVPAFS